MKIKIGTRGSKLALWQAYFVEERLQALGVDTEVIVIHTKGDKILDRSLSKIGSKGVFTEELEEQLLSGEIDIAVHSSKDLQSDLGELLEVISFSKREVATDVLVGINTHDSKMSLSDNITVGTSSTRRVAMLRAYYPHVKIVDMRGNLQTRIQKMEQGDCDALLLAYAGVHRMNYHHLIQEELAIKEFTPAVGQGAVAIEAAKSLDQSKREIIRKACNHSVTERCIKAERAFLKEVNGGCSIPVFGNATLLETNEIQLEAGIVSLDGKEMVRVIVKGEKPEELGQKVAEELFAKGGGKILEEIRKELDA